MVLRTRQELRCEPSGRQGTRKRREETTREDKRKVAGTHSGHGRLPLQVNYYLPQRAQARVGWTVSKGGLMTSLFWFLCSIKACTTALVCSGKGLLLLWQVL